MRWLVTGAGGMLGSDFVEVLATRAVEVTALTRAQLDITLEPAVRQAVAGHDVVVNTAAWTDVDGAEANERQATLINGDAVGVLARACAAAGARLIHVSTDYVFAGDALTPYQENAPVQPINAYGRSKLAGEAAIAATMPGSGYIVRTAWLYGENGRNFVRTMLSLARSRPTLDVVDDQRGQPTWTVALAEQIADLGAAALAGRAPAGIYHGTASGDTTWFGLARAAFELSGLDPERVRPVSGEAFPRPAKRPAFSILAHDRWHAAGLSPQPAWEEQLHDAFSSGVFKAVTP